MMNRTLLFSVLFLAIFSGNTQAELFKIGKLVNSQHKTLNRFAQIHSEFANDQHGAFVRTYLTEERFPCPGGCEQVNTHDSVVDLAVDGLVYEDIAHIGEIDEHNNPVVGRYWLKGQRIGDEDDLLCAKVIEKRMFPLTFIRRNETINLNCRPHVKADSAMFSVRGKKVEFEKIPTLFVIVD